MLRAQEDMLSLDTTERCLELALFLAQRNERWPQRGPLVLLQILQQLIERLLICCRKLTCRCPSPELIELLLLGLGPHY
jgi:hypothetical protein